MCQSQYGCAWHLQQKTPYIPHTFKTKGAGLNPVTVTIWLGVTLEKKMKFMKTSGWYHKKGRKQENFLAILSNTKWGLPLNLFKILITSTVHAAMDYTSAAWLNLPVQESLFTIMFLVNAILPHKELGGQRTSPHSFFSITQTCSPQKLDWLPRSSTLWRQERHQLYNSFKHARKIKPRAHWINSQCPQPFWCNKRVMSIRHYCWELQKVSFPY